MFTYNISNLINRANNLKIPNLILSLFILSLLQACSNSEKVDFVSQCKAQQNSEEYCKCAYDFAKKSLDTDAQYELFAAGFFKDQKKLANAQASLGMMEMVTAGTKILWMGSNLDLACKSK